MPVVRRLEDGRRDDDTAERHLAEHPATAGYIFGHLHLARQDTLASGVTVTFLGDWIDQDTYACLTPDGTITLHHFSAQK